MHIIHNNTSTYYLAVTYQQKPIVLDVEMHEMHVDFAEEPLASVNILVPCLSRPMKVEMTVLWEEMLPSHGLRIRQIATLMFQKPTRGCAMINFMHA